MNILEELKKNAEQRRQDLEQSGSDDSGLFALRSMSTIANLQTIHHYLHDLAAQLNFVQPDIDCEIDIGGYGQFNHLKQQSYQLISDSHVNKETICLTFSLKNEDTLELEVENSIENKEEIEELKTRGLMVNYIGNQPAKIRIQGYIPVRIEFSSALPDAGIQVSIVNFSHLGSQYYALNTDVITEEFLNDLGAFILRRPTNFMDMLVEDSHGISLVKRQPSKTSDDGAPRTEEMEISRLRSLFNREHRLYLTYHNEIKDLGSRTRDFILGRAKDCDLMIKTDLASRHHAHLVYRKGKFVLVDQSTNGTFVKPQGGSEVYVQSEELPLAGSGFISLGKSVTVDNEHLIYYSCQ